MRKYLVTLLAALTLLMPLQAQAQSGDASSLENVEGLELAIGRSWVTPLVPPSASTDATPTATDNVQVHTMNALVYQFDSAENAAAGLEKFNDDQLLLIENDPNTPTSEPFDTDGLGDAAYGYEGILPMPGFSGELEDMAVVNLTVQQDNLVVQLFGSIVPGDHIEISTRIAEDILAADVGEDAPVPDPNGESTGGLWEKLNAVDIEVSPDAVIYDLQIFPMDDDAVQGESVVVPEIDLENIGAVRGLVGSWYTAYGTEDSGTPAATPNPNQTGPFSIELWILEFEDPAHASAAAFSLQQSLTEPLQIVNGSGEGLGSEETQALTLENTGFTGNSLPEGDAGVVIRADGSTLYAARVYTREPAPTPIARNLVQYMAETPAGNGEEVIDGLDASGGVWDRFPKPGDDLLYALEPIAVRFDEPSAEPAATPAG